MQKDIYLRGIYERKSMSHASLLNTIKQKLLFSKKKYATGLVSHTFKTLG